MNINIPVGEEISLGSIVDLLIQNSLPVIEISFSTGLDEEDLSPSRSFRILDEDENTNYFINQYIKDIMDDNKLRRISFIENSDESSKIEIRYHHGTLIIKNYYFHNIDSGIVEYYYKYHKYHKN